MLLTAIAITIRSILDALIPPVISFDPAPSNNPVYPPQCHCVYIHMTVDLADLAVYTGSVSAKFINVRGRFRIVRRSFISDL